MSKAQLRQQLFDVHSNDLQSMQPDLQGYFICPICFEHFSRESLVNKDLTDGHVWPRNLRIRSRLASQQRVLLCRNCNSQTGSKGDAQFQTLEQLEMARKTGKLYDTQHLQLLRKNGQSIFVRGNAIIDETNGFEAKLDFPNHLNDPDQIKTLDTAIKANEDFTILIRNQRPYRTELAKVGMVTSGYLLAFLTFGYRYILNPVLNPVRNHIQESFSYTKTIPLVIPELEGLNAFVGDKHYQHPQIGIVIPLSGRTPVHVQIAYLSYIVQLPFHVQPDLFNELMMSKAPNANPTHKDLVFYIPINHNKATQGSSIWDRMLGDWIVSFDDN